MGKIQVGIVERTVRTPDTVKVGMEDVRLAEIGVLDNGPRKNRCLCVHIDKFTMAELSKIEKGQMKQSTGKIALFEAAPCKSASDKFFPGYIEIGKRHVGKTDIFDSIIFAEIPYNVPIHFFLITFVLITGFPE